MDHHLLKTRKMYPGYYPVNSISIKAVTINNTSTLLIATPKSPGVGALNYSIQVTEVPLAPVLKMKPISDVSRLLEVPSVSYEPKKTY